MSYPMALIDLRLRDREQNIPRAEFLDKGGLCMRTIKNVILLYVHYRMFKSNPNRVQCEGKKYRQCANQQQLMKKIHEVKDI